MSGPRAMSFSLMRRQSWMGHLHDTQSRRRGRIVCGRPSRCLSSASRDWVNTELVDTAYRYMNTTAVFILNP
jgi:hypothetical protein